MYKHTVSLKDTREKAASPTMVEDVKKDVERIAFSSSKETLYTDAMELVVFAEVLRSNIRYTTLLYKAAMFQSTIAEDAEIKMIDKYGVAYKDPSLDLGLDKSSLIRRIQTVLPNIIAYADKISETFWNQALLETYRVLGSLSLDIDLSCFTAEGKANRTSLYCALHQADVYGSVPSSGSVGGNQDGVFLDTNGKAFPPMHLVYSSYAGTRKAMPALPSLNTPIPYHHLQC